MDGKKRSSASSTCKEKGERHVDFNVTVCEEPPHKSTKNSIAIARPKSSLKHFSIDTKG